jgi:hypothetical protein
MNAFLELAEVWRKARTGGVKKFLHVNAALTVLGSVKPVPAKFEDLWDSCVRSDQISTESIPSVLEIGGQLSYMWVHGEPPHSHAHIRDPTHWRAVRRHVLHPNDQAILTQFLIALISRRDIQHRNPTPGSESPVN